MQVKLTAAAAAGGDILETVIASIITGVLALMGVIITDRRSSDKVIRQLQQTQAVNQEKIEALTREVRAHNNFARRLPVVEEQLRDMDRRIGRFESRGRSGPAC